MEGPEVIVADTHVIVWDALKPEMLSTKAQKAIREANKQDGIIFCEISLWEIAMLMKKGRLTVDASYLEFIRLVSDSNNYIFKGLSPEIAELSADLFARTNKDPADRIISATAIIEKANLVTSDKTLRRSKRIDTIW
ncbi:MAG: type II toxin-antitoxin system VapC family toxin [Desulfobacterales bacterium]|nr:type II toxin-antitoxin system VapC family toxin [Desulfobacterales bacterium]